MLGKRGSGGQAKKTNLKEGVRGGKLVVVEGKETNQPNREFALHSAGHLVPATVVCRHLVSRQA